MAAAAAVEMNRILKNEEKKLLSILWQIPQYFLVGGAEAFAYVGQMELFYREAPERMKSMATAVALVGISVGNYVSSAALTGLKERSGWIPEDLGEGHLGYLFSALSGICLLDLVAFSLLATSYDRKSDS